MKVETRVNHVGLKELLQSYYTDTTEKFHITSIHIDVIDSLVTALKIDELADIKLETNCNNDNLYLELTPVTSNSISLQNLETLINQSFPVSEDINSRKNSLKESLVDFQPYKLYVRPDGLKMEVEKQKDQIKLFRFIIPYTQLN